MTLRGYQRDAIDALEKDWAAGLLRLGISLPTGTGKTHVMSELAVEHTSTYRFGSGVDRNGGVLVLVHRDTLVDQTERKMREHGHGRQVTVGVVKAERNVTRAAIVVASVHTLRSEKRLERIIPPQLIIVDEAHVSMSPTYARIFERFPGARVAGFSATWVRSDTKKLGDFWQKISYARSIRWAIREGHLVPPKGIAVGVPDSVTQGLADLRPGRGGEWRDEDLEDLVTVDAVRDNLVRGYFEHAATRPAVLFAPTVKAAEFFRAGLRAAGVSAAGVYAGTGPRDRKRIFAAYRRREVSVLTTCSALAEGWDAPWCSAVLLARPFRHVGSYIQVVGRGLRLWPGKTDALVLDFAGGADGLSLTLDAALTQSRPKLLSPEDDFGDENNERFDPVEDDGETLFKVGKGTRPIDLFAGSEARWLTTEHGVPFIATGDHFYFVCQPPESETWNVGVCRIDASVRGGLIQGGRWLKEGLDADDAVNYATIVAVDDDPSLAGSKSRWRKGKPSQQQIYRARSIGCVLSAEDSRGDVADKLTLRQASLVLEPVGRR
jgi:superfamily II DNA or RNA helicase